MSSLWNIAAHWKGAPERSCNLIQRLSLLTVQPLTIATVTVLCVQWFLLVQLILDSSTMTTGLVYCFKVFLNLVRRVIFPIFGGHTLRRVACEQARHFPFSCLLRTLFDFIIH